MELYLVPSFPISFIAIYYKSLYNIDLYSLFHLYTN